MKTPKFLLASLSMALLAMTSCGTQSATDSSSSEVVASRNGYQVYYDFLLKTAESENMVFSPESLNSAMYVYSHLTTKEDTNAINAFLNNVDYTKYKNTDQFKMINRIWANSNKSLDFSKTGVEDLVYSIDMADSENATNEKNKYVKDQTNGFIDRTASVLDNNTVFDVMNVTYFKDEWKTEKSETDLPIDFNNADGSVAKVNYLCDFNGRMYCTDNAHSYTEEYKNGFLFTIILPDEGYTLTDINIDDFIDNKCKKVEVENNLLMPAFETSSSTMFNFSDFGLNAGNIDENVCKDPVTSSILQTAKIKVDKQGTEAAAVTEIVTKNAIDVEPETYTMTCNRPFVYYIYDTANKDVAFIGVVNNIKDT